MRPFLAVTFVLTFFISNVAWGAPNSNSEMDKYILSLVKAQDFDKLESMLIEIENDYEKDYLKERKVDLAFDTFYRARSDLDRLLGNWIKAKPNSYIAYMARGVYYTKVGWSSRGTAYVDETTKKQFDGMAYYFQKAFKDFEQARSLNKKMLHPLCYEIEILMNYGEKEQIRKLYKEALQINPMSLTARWYYITTILPRWGGSISKIEQEVASARPYYQKNSALKILDGRVTAELGDQAFFNQDYTKAEQLYKDALKFGNHWFYNEQMGEIFGYSRQAERSNKDLKIALELRPNFNRALFMLGMNLYQTQHYKEAISILSEVIDNDQYDHKTLEIRGDCYLRLDKLDLALSDFEKAIILEPRNAEYLADRARVHQMKAVNRPGFPGGSLV